MKKNYIITFLALMFFGIISAQETQKNFINYQGVARDSENALMEQAALEIGIALKFGSVNAAVVYEENHTITTDANGVFSLLIGNGNPLSGDYDVLPWGSAATFVTVSLNGNEIGTTELMAVPYAISAGNTKDPSAAEVPYDNSVSGLGATDTQAAIDELATAGTTDADSDPANEFQTLSFDAGTNELSLSDGNSVTIPSSGTDADADPENELQTLSFDAVTYELSLSDGNAVTIPTGDTDADTDPSNEFQMLSFDSGTNELSLSDGNTVTIPSGSGSSIWTKSGTDIMYDEGSVSIIGGGNLAIGLQRFDLPKATLSVDGNIRSSDFEGGGNVVADVNGNLVIGAGGGGSSLWTRNDDNLFYSDGKVGIGKEIPTGKLHISDVSGFTPFLTLESTSSNPINVRYSKEGNDLIWNQYADIGADETSSTLNYSFWDGGTDHPIITLRGNRKMGVNNSDPQATLDVQGNIRSSLLGGSGERNVMADADGNLVIGSSTGGGTAPTGLEALDEGNGIGWRLVGRNDDDYAYIGQNAIDLSSPSSTLPNAVGASGDYSLAAGWGAIASNNNAISIGNHSHASKGSATAIGAGATADAFQSTALGPGATTKGFSSSAMGFDARAIGSYSMSLGKGTTAWSYASVALGQYNRGIGTGGTWKEGDPILEVGNGDSMTDRSNTLTILKNGNMSLGDRIFPTSRFEIGFNSTVAKAHLKLVENEADYARINFTNTARGGNDFWALAGHIGATEADDRFNIFNSDAGDIMSIHGNGDVVINGTVAHTSDRRLKKDIGEIPYGLGEVLKLQPKSYHWKRDEKDWPKSLGLIAQEVMKVIPEIVHKDSDPGKTLGVSYTELVPVLIKAIHEQQEIIDQQSNKISDMEERLKRLEAKFRK